MFRTLSPALFAGFFASIVLSIAQAIWISPLILQAEVYEDAAETGSIAAHELNHSASESSIGAEHEHHHDQEWTPENGWERRLYSAAANLVMGVGFALILVGAFYIKAPKRWVNGLYWGVAGYAVFFAAPSLGLSPELPGTAETDLTHRQEWWLATVLASATGLALIVWARSNWLKLFGAAILVLPHLIGAPKPEFESALAPVALQHQFVYATYVVNALFWLALGSSAAYLFSRNFLHNFPHDNEKEQQRYSLDSSTWMKR